MFWEALTRNWALKENSWLACPRELVRSSLTVPTLPVKCQACASQRKSCSRDSAIKAVYILVHRRSVHLRWQLGHFQQKSLCSVTYKSFKVGPTQVTSATELLEAVWLMPSSGYSTNDMGLRDRGPVWDVAYKNWRIDQLYHMCSIPQRFQILLQERFWKCIGRRLWQ